MIASLSFLTDADFFSGVAVEGLVESFADVGCSTAFDRDIAMVGDNTAVRLSDATMGGQGVAVGVRQTGAAGDEVALLAGASGVDTLGDTQAAAVMTGRNATAEAAGVDLGADTMAIHEAAPVTGLSRDLRVSVILHRIAMFSPLAPAPVGFPSGHGA